VTFEHLCNIPAYVVKYNDVCISGLAFVRGTLFDPHSVVYRDVTRRTKGLYRLKHVGALRSGLAYLSRCNSGWFCHRPLPASHRPARAVPPPLSFWLFGPTCQLPCLPSSFLLPDAHQPPRSPASPLPGPSRQGCPATLQKGFPRPWNPNPKTCSRH
jgi:hypothetical protein